MLDVNSKNILYKYRNWDNAEHRRALENNEFFLASPAAINDPFDFQTVPDLSLLKTSIQREAFIDILISNTIRGQARQNLRRNLIQKLEKNPDLIQAQWNAVNERFTNDRFGVTSFSFRWDSILMWSHYGNNHRGFCIGIHRKAVEAMLIGVSGPVKYGIEFPRVDPLNNNDIESILLKSHYKAKEWEYEEEYRIATLWDSTPTVDQRKFHIQDGEIVEVVLGTLVSNATKNEILEICKPKKIPVYRTRKGLRSFNLERILLQNQ